MNEDSVNVLVLHGPNLNLLGTRQPEIYGKTTLAEINQNLLRLGKEMQARVKYHQSNHEGQIVDWLHEYRQWAHGIIMNPGALTHYSYSIHDAIIAVEKPVMEVHISNIHKRESWRKKSVISPVCMGQIMGLGPEGYYKALRELLSFLRKK